MSQDLAYAQGREFNSKTIDTDKSVQNYDLFDPGFRRVAVSGKNTYSRYCLVDSIL